MATTPRLKAISLLAARIDRLFNRAATEAARLGSRVRSLPAEELFRFDDYPLLRDDAEALFRALRTELTKQIRTAVEEAGAPYPASGRSRRKLDISERVWKYTDECRREIELGLDEGIRSGEGVAKMARSLKQYLKEPERLYRRVRTRHGRLRLSKAAAAYHPGRGVYRSSWRNARRLAITETNMAYLEADYERYSRQDFVVGVRVCLSGNHTCLGADGKPHRFTDICDALAGDYPKDFKFTGWHPQCRCHVEPILKTPEEMKEDRRRMEAGGEPAPAEESANYVGAVPENFRKWIRENAGRISEAEKRRTLPYFITDNRAAVEEVLKGQAREETVEKRRKEYQDYSKQGWQPLYFDEVTGGYNVAHKAHQFKNSKPKGVPKTGGEAELWLGKQLAIQGKAVLFLPESGINGKSGDMRFDGKVWDCKYIPIANEGTIRTCLKDAKKADCVIFTTCGEKDRYDDIIKAVDREIGRYKSRGRNVEELPDVYVFDNEGQLKLLKKIKGT